MKQKLLPILLTSFIFVGIGPGLKAQIDSFKLADFKLPDLKRQGVDINYNMNGNMSNINYNDESTPKNQHFINPFRMA